MLDSIEFFTITVETGSFAAAARRLRVTPSAVSRRVGRLERELGVALLARTTRTLRLTDDGRAFHERCVRVLEELGEARAAIARTIKKPSGLLRVDAPMALGRHLLVPAIPRFLDRYRELRVDLTLRDQFVDPIAEGLDVLIRIGRLADSNLIARRLGESRIVHCAAPAYLRKRGTPAQPRDLVRHLCISYLREGQPTPFQFVAPGGELLEIAVTGAVHANDAGAIVELAVAGRGIASVFDFTVRDAIARGALVPILRDHSTVAWPIHALYPKNRHLVAKVRAFLDFLPALFR